MLAKRIIGAFRFRAGVYAEVRKDHGFTNTAWILVIVVGFLNQLGSHASRVTNWLIPQVGGTVDLSNWLIASIGGTIFVVLAFAMSAFVIQWVGHALFKADVTFDELVRTLGLAYIWQIGGFIGVLAAFSTAPIWRLAPSLFVFLALIAWIVAAKEAMQLRWLQTILTIIAGSIPVMVITYVGSALLGLLGAGGAALWGGALSGGVPLTAGPFCPTITILLLIWAVWTGFVPLLRLGFRQWVPLVLLYTLWIGSFWGLVIVRIYLPPEHAFSAVALAVVLLVLYFSYPLLQGVAAHIIHAHNRGKIPSWRSAFVKARHRYPRMLVVFSLILLVYTLVVFGVYASFGQGWAEYFRAQESGFFAYKTGILLEGLLAGSIFSIFVDMFPPMTFPLGAFVGLANPSSEFLLAMVVASLAAVGILFIPMLRLIFWLPLVTLGQHQSVLGSLLHVWRAPLRRAMGKEIAVVLRSFGLWLVLVVPLAWLTLAGFWTGVTLSLGRWVAPAEMWGYTPVALGIFPGFISLILQHERIRLYGELFEPP